jgi:hypothetical protein
MYHIPEFIYIMTIRKTMNRMINLVISVHPDDEGVLAGLLKYLHDHDLGWEIPSSSDAPSFSDNIETYFQMVDQCKNASILDHIPSDDIERAKEHITRLASKMNKKVGTLVQSFHNSWVDAIEALEIECKVTKVEYNDTGIIFINFTSDSNQVEDVQHYMESALDSTVVIGKDDGWYLSFSVPIEYGPQVKDMLATLLLN